MHVTISEKHQSHKGSLKKKGTTWLALFKLFVLCKYYTYEFLL